MLGSEVIEVLVGENRQPFIVHIDLLTIHSRELRRQIDSRNKLLRTRPICASYFQPWQFSCFLLWIYTGECGSYFKDSANKQLDDQIEGAYLVGHRLDAPQFQNHCMDILLSSIQKDHAAGCNYWPGFVRAEDIYDRTSQHDGGNKDGDCKLRKLVANMMAYGRSKVYWTVENTEKGWRKLLEDQPDLSMDISCATPRKPNDPPPWSSQFRKEYMVAEEPLGHRWESQILAQRSKADIEKEAGKGCVRSILELNHLNRRR
jgi:hypothetical protein